MPEAQEARTSVSYRQIIIVSICLAYLALRYWGITSSCLWFDEIFSIHAAEHAWGDMLWFVAQDLIHPPLFYLLLKGWIAIGGESLLWLRSFSVFFAVLSVVPFLRLCREFKLGLTETVFAFCLFAANGALIKYAQEVRMYSLLLFLATTSFWLFARFYFRGKNIWVLTLVNILLVYAHYFGWLVVLSEVVAIFVLQRIKIRHVMTMAAIAAASYVPWVWAIWKAAAAGSDVGQNIKWIATPTLSGVFNFLCALVEPFYYQQSSADPTSLYYISVPLLAVIIGAAIFYTRGETDVSGGHPVYLLIIFSATPVLITFLASLILPYSVWGNRHLVIVFVPAIILAAKLVSGVDGRKVRTALLGLSAAVFLIALSVRAAAPSPQYIWCGWDSLADTLKNSQTKQGTRPRVYVFEDLAAYHFWFRSRETADFEVSLLKGVDDSQNDPAYFLPRGFDDVRVVSPDEFDENDIYIAFRRGTIKAPDEAVQTILFSQMPIAWFTEKGLRPVIVEAFTAGSETAYLVHLTR